MGNQLDGNFLPGSLPYKFILIVTSIICYVVNKFISLSSFCCSVDTSECVCTVVTVCMEQWRWYNANRCRIFMWLSTQQHCRLDLHCLAISKLPTVCKYVTVCLYCGCSRSLCWPDRQGRCLGLHWVNEPKGLQDELAFIHAVVCEIRQNVTQ